MSSNAKFILKSIKNKFNPIMLVYKLNIKLLLIICFLLYIIIIQNIDKTLKISINL